LSTYEPRARGRVRRRRCEDPRVHSYDLGPGNHADAWDRAAVLLATEEITSTEL